jgi:hypothetical protein
VTNLEGVRTLASRGVMNRLAHGAAPAVLLVLVAAGCAAEEAEGPSGSTATSSVSPLPRNSSSAPSPQTPTADVMVNVTIAEGKVTPIGASTRVDVGQSVQVTAISDVDESLHVHGYDKTLTVTPGQPTTVTFVADQSGVFEIETHESGKLVAKLIVS